MSLFHQITQLKFLISKFFGWKAHIILISQPISSKFCKSAKKSNQKTCTIDFSFTILQNMNGIFDQIWYLSIKATCHIYEFDFIINFGRQVIFYIIQNIMILKFEDIFLFLWHFYIIRNQLKSIDLSMDIF